MKLGILSDTHSNLTNLHQALDWLREREIDTILHCGDLSGVSVVQAMADFDVWIAEGNVDRGLRLEQVIEETFGPGRFAWLHRLTLGGYPVALTHGENEEALSNLIGQGEYTYVIHGHTHRRRDERVGRTRVINPGALGGTRKEARSFCVLDLEADHVRFVQIRSIES